MSIIDFINARLDEDEAIARAAEKWADKAPNPAIRWVGKPGDELIHTFGVAGPHIARHDPERVLRQVAALRGVLGQLAAMPPRIERWGTEPTLNSIAFVWSDHPDYQQWGRIAPTSDTPL